MAQTPIQYREEILKPFFSYTKGGESFYVVGAPSVGKTRLMDFLMGDDPDVLRENAGVDRERVKNKYLPTETSAKTWLVRVDMNRMRQEHDWGFQFYELLLHTVLLSCNRLESTEQNEAIRMKLAALDSEVIESKDPLKAHRLFEMAVNMLCQSYDIRLCFLFDEFDETYKAMPREVFAQLRAVRDANKYRVSYVLFLRNLPEKLRDPLDNEGFYELISRNMLGLGPYTGQDTLHIIGQLEKRREYPLAQDKREWILVNSGGHPGLILALFAIFKENSRAAAQMANLEWFTTQDSVREEFRKIWAGLLDEEKGGLVEFAKGNYTAILPDTGKLLTAKGLLKPSGGKGMVFFSPLFGYWILKH